jgi:hypothetical protein
MNSRQINNGRQSRRMLESFIFGTVLLLLSSWGIPVDAFYIRSAHRSLSALYITGSDDGYDGLGEYDPSDGLRKEREVVVGDPQLRLKEKERSVTSILKELAAIQQQGPQKYCILGTRHCSYLHQQIVELLYVIRYSLLIDSMCEREKKTSLFTHSSFACFCLSVHMLLC